MKTENYMQYHTIFNHFIKALILSRFLFPVGKIGELTASVAISFFTALLKESFIHCVRKLHLLRLSKHFFLVN